MNPLSVSPALHIVSPGAAKPEPGSLDHIAARRLRHLERRVVADNYSAESLKRDRSYLRSFLGFVYADGEGDAPPVRIGSLPVAQAGQVHLTAWLLAHFDRWKRGSTRGDALGVILGCYNWWADEEDLCPPFRRPRKMSFPRTHFRAMRRHHYRAIMRAARRHAGSKAIRLAMFFAWHTGSRLAEMRKLLWDHIDWEAGLLRDLDNKTEHLTGKLRTFAVGPRLLAVLKILHQNRRPGQRHVFLTRRGRPWLKDNLGRRYARYRTLAGVPEAIKFAGCRHGYAVRLKLAGEDSKNVADQLGHAGTRMVDSIYANETRYDGDHLRQIATRAERRTKPIGQSGGLGGPAGPRLAQLPPPKPPAPTPLFDQLTGD